MDSIDPLFEILARAGAEQYGNERVTQLDHALQSARLAERAGSSPALVTAALLHDVGHLIHDLGDDAAVRGIDDRHEVSGAAFLARWFGPEVSEPIRLHVDAKRWLCHAEQAYFDHLSPGSVRSLALQGGPFDDEGAARFLAEPFARDAIQVRRWDDDAKVLGLETPSLAHFRALAERCRRVA